jgi:glycine/D-amino acid oxidase-like deaminating enzyme
MNRSIDLMEELAHESGNIFRLSRRGYLFVTADPGRIPDLKRAAEEPCSLGAGPLRIHTGQPGDPDYVPAPVDGFEGLPTGADLIFDPGLILKHFPFLSKDVVAALHTRRCGRLSAQQLGMYMLEKARQQGVKLLCARVVGVDVRGEQVQAVHLDGEFGSQKISTDTLINAAGPFVKQISEMVGVDLPVYCELHAKIAYDEYLEVIPRSAPLYYWADPQKLPWTEEEQLLLAESEESCWLLEPFPSGPHGLPEGSRGSRTQLALWTYDVETVEPVVPLPPIDPHYFEVVLRGLSRMIPGLRAYFDKLPRPVMDGGYYAKTRENRPLIGPLPVEGAYVLGALSGFGIMAACAAGELLAAHVIGSELPPYAGWFLLDRYQDPGYRELLDNWDESGQL